MLFAGKDKRPRLLPRHTSLSIEDKLYMRYWRSAFR